MKGTLEVDAVQRLVYQVLYTRSVEIACDECMEHLDYFVEMTLDGANAAQALPLVQHHLEQCSCCYEEFEALLSVLRTLD
jgi:hypothetical protein